MDFLASFWDPLILSYVTMGVMAVCPIYFGSYASVQSADAKKESETMKREDAYWFPVIGSVFLFSFYLLFKFFPKDMINMLITSYFSAFGTLALVQVVSPVIRRAVFSLTGFSPAEGAPDKEGTKISWLEFLFAPAKIEMRRHGSVMIAASFDIIDVFALFLSSVFTIYYVLTKNWIASNIFGEAFAFGAISLIDFDSFITGSIFLSGLFLYDIFWVFGTDVMVTVARSFEAPVKLVFPRNLFADSFQFAMLGLGDVIIPGAFVALCLRFDHERAGRPAHSRYPKPYFRACMIAYSIGLAITILAMHTFKAAQPALLYLSPACILSVLAVALLKGEPTTVWNFTTVKEQAAAEPTKEE